MKCIFILLVTVIAVCGQAQPTSSPKVHDVFLDYLTEKISLTTAEKKQMRPLVIRYLNDSKNISKTNEDPLLREQKRVGLKINYRKLFVPIIGAPRANRFFAEEQLFRKKIRDELRKRNVKEN